MQMWYDNQKNCHKVLDSKEHHESSANQFLTHFPVQNGIKTIHYSAELHGNCHIPQHVTVSYNEKGNMEQTSEICENKLTKNNYVDKQTTYITSKTIQLSNCSYTSEHSTRGNGRLHVAAYKEFCLTCNSSQQPAITLSLRPNYFQSLHKKEATKSALPCTPKGHRASVNFKFEQNPSGRLQTISSSKGEARHFKSDVKIFFSSDKNEPQNNIMESPYRFQFQNMKINDSMSSGSLHPRSIKTSTNLCAPVINGAMGKRTKQKARLAACSGNKEQIIAKHWPRLGNAMKFKDESSTMSTHSQSHIQAVLHHQKLRIEVLRKAMIKEAEVLYHLQNDVKELEQKLQKSNASVAGAINGHLFRE